MINNVNTIGQTGLYTAVSKENGDSLSGQEWTDISNAVATAHGKINEIITNGTSGGGAIASESNVSVTETTEPNGDTKAEVAIISGISALGSPSVIELTKKKKGVNTTLISGNNINIEPRESVDTTKGGNISLKPGDDIELCSHHRLADNQDEVSVKVIDGDDVPVKLQVNMADMTITTKNKPGSDSSVFNVNVNSAKNTKGYLKVRAQAIDLRCEEHGGIALQPKGADGEGFENKIKFEHGGGDGLEFGTFNTQHTSLYTNDYRFKKDGVIRLAGRFTEVSNKANPNDATTAYKYIKNNIDNNADKTASENKQFDAADDFYDFIESSDPTCTWRDVVDSVYKIKYDPSAALASIKYYRVVLMDYNDVSQTSEDVVNYTDPIYTNIRFTELFQSTASFTEVVIASYDLCKILNLPSLENEQYLASVLEGDSKCLYVIDKIGNRLCFYIQEADSTTYPEKTCSVNDIITLIDYFKTGAGQANGPWATAL